MQSEYTTLLAENALIGFRDVQNIALMADLQRLVYPHYKELEDMKGVNELKQHLSYVAMKQEDYSKKNTPLYLKKAITTYALPYFIGNRIRHNTKSSREFSDKISQDDGTIAMIPEKELFNRSTLDGVPLVQMEFHQDTASSNKAFYEKLNGAFNKITDKIKK